MKYSVALLALIGLIASTSLRAQSPLEVDAIAFRYDSTRIEVEVDYGVLERALAFKQVNNTWTAPIAARIEIWQNGAVADKKDIRDTVRFSGTQQQLDSVGANKLLGTMVFPVVYAPLTFAAFLWDRGSKDGKAIYDTIVIPVTIPDHDRTKFALGGIEFGSSMEKSNGAASPFEKSGYIYTPNPSAVYGENYTKLFFYSELYVPHASVDPAQSVNVITAVVDANGKEVVSNTQRVALLGESLPIMEGIDIDGLASDSYKLRIRVKSEDAIVAEAEKQFYYSSGMKLSEEAPERPTASALNDSELFAGSDFAKMTEAEINERLPQSMYWGSELDQKAAKKLTTLDSKQHFLFTFWRQQDAIHHSAQPFDAYRLFLKRLGEAETQFKYQKTPGWKTDRGRIWITYGPPARVTTVTFDPSLKPYIIWEYDRNSEMRLRDGNFPQFAFLDRQGGGNYFLVHSNVIGENYEPDWQTREALRLAH